MKSKHQSLIQWVVMLITLFTPQNCSISIDLIPHHTTAEILKSLDFTDSLQYHSNQVKQIDKEHHHGKEITIASTTSSSSSLQHTVYVGSEEDLTNPSCSFDSKGHLNSSHCSLRGAWTLCSNITEACTISLLATGTLTFNITQGPLELQEDTSISIEGNGALVTALVTKREWIEDHIKPIQSLRYDPKTDGPSKWATFQGCSGMQFIFSTCNDGTTGDTLLSLHHDGVMLDYSNIGCGLRSMIVYSIPISDNSSSVECSEYSVRYGCYEDEPCKLRLDAYYILRNQSWEHQFIKSTSNIQSGLNLKNFSVSGFGSISTDGGAISINGNVAVSISNMNFMNNIGYRGGAVAVFGGGTLTITDSSFTYNKAIFTGGSVFVGGVTAWGSSISNTDIQRSMSIYDSGGAIGLEKVINVQISNIQAGWCSSTLNGGSIYVNQSLNVLIDSVILTNTTTAGSGGAIYSAFSQGVSLSKVNIIGSRAEVAGGVITYTSFNTNWKDISVSYSFATQYGGALLCLGCIVFQGEDLFSTDSYAVIGGGMGFYEIRKAIVQNVQVVRALAGDGGGIYINGAMDCVFNNMQISDTIAARYGGGLYLLRGTSMMFQNCFISNSSALMGGGLYMGNTIGLELVKSQITDCHAAHDGGGLYFDNRNSYFFMAEVNATFNIAEQNGGGVFIGSNNQYMNWLSWESYRDMKTFTASKSTVPPKALSFPGANGVVIYFDNSTLFNADWNYCCTRLLVYEKKSDGSKNSQALFSGYYGIPLPGIDLEPMMISSNEIILEYHNIHNFSNNYVKLFVIPIYKRSRSCNIENNIARFDGGGMMISHVNPVFVSIDTVIADNQAMEGNGGGMVLETANIKSLVAYNNFKNNWAHDDGGGVFVGFSHHSTIFRNCQFLNNQADRYGGGKYISSNNGNGALMAGYEISCRHCLFSYNTAILGGGALYLEDQNSYLLTMSNLSSNEVLVGDGAAIMLDSRNALTLVNTTLDNNNAQHGCGGGIAVLHNSNHLDFEWSILHHNGAKSGGGLCIKMTTSWSIKGQLYVFKNFAEDAGGAFLLSSTQLWTQSKSHIIFDGNIAQRGSALFLHQISNETLVTDQLSFKNNVAKNGTTIYWIYDGSGNLLMNVSKIPSARWVNNYDSYGFRIGTQPIKIIGNHSYDIIKYHDDSLNPPILFTLYDHFGQIVDSHGVPHPFHISVEIADSNCTNNQRPYIAGDATLTTGIKVKNGIATVKDLRPFCYPGGWMDLQFKLSVDPLIAIVSNPNSYNLNHTTTLHFQHCQFGETVSTDGLCITCANGTYKLPPSSEMVTFPYEIDECKSCMGITGVNTCQGAEIYLEPGHWRRFPHSEAVLPCLLGYKSCPGGSGSGDSVCAEGYTGPLCSICADDHYLMSGECFPCKQTNFSSPTIFILIVSLIACAYGLLLVAFWYYKDEEEANKPRLLRRISRVRQWIREFFGEVVVKIKIIVATFQVVISAADVFNVVMPGKFASFCRSFNVLNMNLGSLIPTSCYFDRFEYNFMFRLFLATIGPLVMVCILLIAMVIERYILKPTRLRFQYGVGNRIAPRLLQKKSKEYDSEIKARYVNYIFYLTYLILPSVTTTIFKLFVCENIDPNREDSSEYDLYLVADMRITCTSDYYHQWRFFGLIMIFIYPIGIPFFYWLCLYSFREEIMQPRDDFEGGWKRLSASLMGDSNRQRESAELSPMAVSTHLSTSLGEVSPSPGIRNRFSRNIYQNEQKEAEHDRDHDRDRDRGRSGDLTPHLEHPSDGMACPLSISIPTEEPQTPLPSSPPRRMLQRGPSTAILISKRSKTVMRISFLWEAYKPQYWYWELVETSRRILLTAVLSIYATGTTEQTVVGIMMAFIFMKVYSHFDPYISKQDSKLAEIGQTQIVATYFAAVVISAELIRKAWHEWCGGILIALNLSVIVMGFYFEIVAYLEDHPRKNKKKDESDNKPPSCWNRWMSRMNVYRLINANKDEDPTTFQLHGEESNISYLSGSMPDDSNNNNITTNTATFTFTVSQDRSTELEEEAHIGHTNSYTYEEADDIENRIPGIAIDALTREDNEVDYQPCPLRIALPTTTPPTTPSTPASNLLRKNPHPSPALHPLITPPHLGEVDESKEENLDEQTVNKEVSMTSTTDYDEDEPWQMSVGAQAPLEIII